MRYRSLADNPELLRGLADVRGWKVTATAEDEKLGKVDDVLIDDSGRARYFDVSVGSLLNPKHILLPVDLAEVVKSKEELRVPISKDDVKTLPDYGGNPAAVTEEYEMRVRQACQHVALSGREASAARFGDPERPPERRPDGTGKGEEHVTRSKEELVVGKRPVEAGEVGIRKTVETEHVRHAPSRSAARRSTSNAGRPRGWPLEAMRRSARTRFASP